MQPADVRTQKHKVQCSLPTRPEKKKNPIYVSHQQTAHSPADGTLTSRRHTANGVVGVVGGPRHSAGAVLTLKLAASAGDGLRGAAVKGRGAGSGVAEDGVAIVALTAFTSVVQVRDEVVTVRNGLPVTVRARLGSRLTCSI
jgi:hypothetical protein